MTATVAPSMVPVAGAAFVRPLTAGTGVRLYGSSSGYVGLKPASAAGSTDYTLPSSPPSVDGQVLVGTTAGVLSWATVSGASPSGSGTELQYRSGASTFGAVTGSSVANGGIALVLQSASQVGASITLASGQSANAINVTSYGGTAGDKFCVTTSGRIKVSGGSYNLPSVMVDVAGGSGLGSGGNNIIQMVINSVGRILWSQTSMTLASNIGLKWGQYTEVGNDGSPDIGLVRNAAGVVEINNGTAGTYRDLRARNVILTTSTPASASDTGTTGTIAWDGSYIYVCTATNTWKRAALATW